MVSILEAPVDFNSNRGMPQLGAIQLFGESNSIEKIEIKIRGRLSLYISGYCYVAKVNCSISLVVMT